MAGGRPLTRRDDFDFAFFRGGLPFAVLFIAKGRLLSPLTSAFPHSSTVSPNYKIPANPFKPLNFRASHSNPGLPILERSLSTTDSLPQSLPTSVLRTRAAHLAARVRRFFSDVLLSTFNFRL